MSKSPECIVGHGTLGRLLARLTVALGGEPVVWCTDRIAGARGYRVINPAQDERKNYRLICDVSGDASLLDSLISRLVRRAARSCLPASTAPR